MIERYNSVRRKSLAGWTLQISLVLSLTLFSVHGVESQPFAPAAPKIELAEGRSSYFKKTACFKKVSSNNNSFQEAFNLTSRVISSLRQYDNTLKAKFRVNLKILAIVKDRDKTFQSKQHLNNSRDESDRNKSRG
jgi:hypothetical protein